MAQVVRRMAQGGARMAQGVDRKVVRGVGRPMGGEAREPPMSHLSPIGSEATGARRPRVRDRARPRRTRRSPCGHDGRSRARAGGGGESPGPGRGGPRRPRHGHRAAGWRVVTLRTGCGRRRRQRGDRAVLPRRRSGRRGHRRRRGEGVARSGDRTVSRRAVRAAGVGWPSDPWPTPRRGGGSRDCGHGVSGSARHRDWQ